MLTGCEIGLRQILTGALVASATSRRGFQRRWRETTRQERGQRERGSVVGLHAAQDI